MKLAFAAFSLLLNSAFSQDPWTIQPGTVELDPDGDTLKVSHIIGDSPINTRVTLFNKGCQTEIGANETVTLSSQTYFSPTSSPSVSFSPSASLMPTWGPRKAVAPNALANDAFGMSVGLSETTIVVGAPWRDDNGMTNVGTFYMFSSDLSFDKQVYANNAAAGDNFGYAVAVSDSHIVVGAYADDDKGTDSGSAYIYTIAGDLVTKIVASDGTAGDFFGVSVAIEGSNIVIGARRKNFLSASIGGAAYHFDTAGNQIRKLLPPSIGANDQIGTAVAISGDTFVIGVPNRDTRGTDSGSACIFYPDGRRLVIYPDNNTASGLFGRAVSLSSSHIVVGAPWDDNGRGTNAGSVYVFSSTGTRLNRIFPPNTRSNQHFGKSVLVTDELIIVGATDNINTGPGGEVYIYNLSGSLLKRVTASDRAVGDYFGESMAVRGDILVVGAYYKDILRGSIYTFNIRDLV